VPFSLYLPTYGNPGALVFGEIKTAPGEVNTLYCRGAEGIVVSLPGGGFTAVYYRTARRPHLALRERTKTDDQELLAEALHAAVAKARELGWIV
jgi:hypothetical protein